MPLPQNLSQQLEELLQRFTTKQLENLAARLSDRYRQQEWDLTESERLCYAAFRMPATYAVISHLTQNLDVTTVLDVGAGPGTASFAIDGEVTALERSREFVDLGKTLGAPCRYLPADFTKLVPDGEFDLVLFSYSYGEVKKLSLAPFWNVSSRYLLIIEPGTPMGWEAILRAREELIGLGAHVLGPCPHHKACPLTPPDWCHFGVKLERSHLHKRLKKGSLGYEEEKFSYLLVGREAEPCGSRILRAPQKRSGHVLLKLCAPDGSLQKMTVSKKDSHYRTARSSRWGDVLDL